jgi:DNA polymerase I-like protein with 3'-5' exonuclease and polymerase domains
LEAKPQLPKHDPEDTIIALGSSVVKALASLGAVPKNRTISSLRYPNIVKLSTGAELIVSESSAMRTIDYRAYVRMLVDLSMAFRRVKTGSWEPKFGEYQWVENFSGVVNDIEEMYAANPKPIPVALDLETIGLDYLHPEKWVLTVQVSWQEGKAVAIHLPTQEAEQKAFDFGSPIRDEVDFILNSPKISLRGANLKFDLLWLWYRAGLECSNFHLDTMVLGSLLDEDRGNSLNLHTKVYVPELAGYDDTFNQKYKKIKGQMHLVPKDDLLVYACGDADAARRVSRLERKEVVTDHSLARFYTKILHPAVRSYEQVERTGVLVDLDYYLSLEQELLQEMESLNKQAKKLVGGRVLAKHKNNTSLTKAALLIDYLFTPLGLNLKPKLHTPKGQISTASDHLNMFAQDPKAEEFLSLFRQFSSASKMLSTYVLRRDKEGIIQGGFLSHLRSDGRFHPTYFFFNGDVDDGGTITGRLSARDPAFQTLPKHSAWAKKLRKAFIAPPGHLILSHDYSQGELKIAACIANEETMISAYLNGLDLHAVTASSNAGYTWDQWLALLESDPEAAAKLRQLGKAGNFGLIYGMSPGGFIDYAYFTYGVKLTSEQAEDTHEKFFKGYPKLKVWHKSSIDFGRKNKLVRSPLGRIKHLPHIDSYDSVVRSKAERQSINAPVQGTLSDLSLWATSIFWKNGWLKESPVIGMVHDQLLSYVPEDSWEKCEQRNREIMENLPFKQIGWKPQLQFTVDGELGKNLGEMSKLKK